MLIATLLISIVIHGALTLEPTYDIDQALDYFNEFVKTHNKVYKEDEVEDRLRIFTDNLAMYNRFNDEYGEHLYKIHELSDKSYEELISKGHFGASLSNETAHSDVLFEYDIKQAPAEIDWRRYLGPAKDQKHCGSCWAFSACATIEAQYAIKLGNTLDLSEQQLVDCDSMNHGCESGNPGNAFLYLSRANVGMMSENDYPYRQQNGQCMYEPGRAIVRVANGMFYEDRLSEEEIMAMVGTYGPVSAIITASPSILSAYGVDKVLSPTDCYGDLTSHAVNIAGYGMEDGIPYWTIRSSWGPTWGKNGYIKLRRGLNLCKITSHIATVDLQ